MEKYLISASPSKTELNWNERNPSSYLSRDDAFRKLQKAMKRAEKKKNSSSPVKK